MWKEQSEIIYLSKLITNFIYFGSNKTTNNHTIVHRVQLRNRCLKGTCLKLNPLIIHILKHTLAPQLFIVFPDSA